MSCVCPNDPNDERAVVILDVPSIYGFSKNKISLESSSEGITDLVIL
jgi:hypothetical protein